MPKPQIKGKGKILSQSEMMKIFGVPKPDGSHLTTIVLPYTMFYDKNPVRTMRCHPKVASAFMGVFNDLLNHYGNNRLVELDITDFGGCFNYRLMRGSKTQLSTHSWGTAIDLDANRNTLKETAKTARFARPEYIPMIDIFYKWGFVSLGVERGFDWMHFQHSGIF